MKERYTFLHSVLRSPSRDSKVSQEPPMSEPPLSSGDSGPVTAVYTHPPFLIVELQGDLDEYAVHDLHRAFAHLPSGTSGVIVLDMTRVSFVDSDGFGALINIQKRLAETGCRLVLVGCREAVLIALALTRLEVLFPNYSSVNHIPTVRP